jgi:GNAT superfamily N-acetyltransferase
MLHEQARTLPIGPDRQRIVAVADRGWIAGFVEVGHYPWLPAQHFWLWVVVDPRVEHRGIGTQLHHTALAFARERGATRLYSQVRDDCQACLDFAQQRGFSIARHLWESTLELSRFDERRFAGVVDGVAATGIRFFTPHRCGRYSARPVAAL